MSGGPQHPARCGWLALALAATLLVSGCVWTGWPLGRKPVQLPERPDPQRATASEGAGWKVVTAKREPRFLIARDGTECMVTPAKWEAAVIGEQAFCVWAVPRS